jgi:hypothetical protein
MKGLSLYLTILLGAVFMSRCHFNPFKELPLKINGWEAGVEGQVYNSENLFDYINGGAELYLSYGFKRLHQRTYVREGQPEIIVDIFDMETPANAFGVFSHSREVVNDDFGQGSEYHSGFLRFWKNRYYISILGTPVTDEAKKTIFALGRIVEGAITEKGALPEIVKLLPPANLVAESVRYFHHYIWINTYYYIADENILQIDKNTEVLLAEYRSAEGNSFLLIVRYTSPESSRSAYQNFMTAYSPDADKEGGIRDEKGSWTFSRLYGNTVVAVFQAKTRQGALTQISRVRKRINDLGDQ